MAYLPLMLNQKLSLMNRFRNIYRMIVGLILLISGLQPLSAQTAKVTGYVKDSQSGEPIIGAYIVDPENLSFASTNNFGLFSIRIATAGLQKLIISHIGYSSDTLDLSISVDTIIQVNLTPGIVLEEVSVTASVTNISNRSQMSMLHIRPVDIDRLPALIEKDVMKSLQLLPGVASGAEGQSGLFVRGGSLDQNLFLLDGIPLYHVNHLGNYLSVFDSESLKDIKLFKGAFPASYGGRLSSIVDIRVKDGNKYERHGNFSLGLISSGLMLEGPIKQGKSSYLISLRRFWPDLFMVPLTSSVLDGGSVGYNFYDNIIKINTELTAKDKIFISHYFGRDAYSSVFKEKGSTAETNATNRLKWGNTLLAGKWTHLFNSSLFSEFILGYTRYQNTNYSKYEYNNTKDNYKESSMSEYRSLIDDYSLNLALEYNPYNRLRLKFGGGIILHSFKPGTLRHESDFKNSEKTYETVKNPSVSTLENFIYSENQIMLTKSWNINAGLRWYGYKTDNKYYHGFEPRVATSLAVKGLFSISASYNRMNQFVHMLTNSALGLTADLWMPTTPQIAPESSDQFAVGIMKSFSDVGIDITIEAYEKRLNNLITFKEGASFFTGTEMWEDKVVKEGKGSSRGLEILIQKTKGNTTGWVSYTLSKTTRQFESINNSREFPFKYDRPHDFSIVLKRKLNEKLDLSMTWVYSTGLPVTLPIGKHQTIASRRYFNNTGPIFTFEREGHLYSDMNDFRMRDYHRLDIGINHTKEKKRGTRILAFNVYNAYNRQNPLYYYIDYVRSGSDSDGSVTQMKVFQKSLFPIMPSISYSYKF
jgi:hypothetical protein